MVGVLIMDSKTIVMLVAYVIIYAAVDLRRNEASKIPFLSKWWFLKIAMVTTGGVMLIYYA